MFLAYPSTFESEKFHRGLAVSPWSRDADSIVETMGETHLTVLVPPGRSKSHAWKLSIRANCNAQTIRVKIETRELCTSPALPEPVTMRGLFVTGTDTGVGKTWVSCRLVRALREAGVRVGAVKPACSGSVPGPDGTPRWEDLDALSEALGHAWPPERISPQRFDAPLAPPVAARLAGRTVDPLGLRAAIDWWRPQVDRLVVEGVGGLLCPLTERETVADLAADAGFPLLIVARLGLGTLNHVLLTLEVARSRGLAVAGIVLNEAEPGTSDLAAETNPDELRRRTDVPVLAVVRHGTDVGLLPPDPHLRMTVLDRWFGG